MIKDDKKSVYPDGDEWPEVPEPLRMVEFRIDGTFREILTKKKFSNADIGMLIRCLALDTDEFLGENISNEVFHYRNKLIMRNEVRLRVAASRRKKRNLMAGGLTASMDVTVTRKSDVTVTNVEKTDNQDAPPSPIEKTPSQQKEKTPPIVPLKEKEASPLEKYKSVTSKKKKTVESVSEDLFTLAAGRSKEEPAKTDEKRALEPSDHSGGEIVHQDIERDPAPVHGPQNDASRDSRQDLAWIPERFERFWNMYPRKVAKGAAYKAFTKLIKAQKDVEGFMGTLMASLAWWKAQASWTKDGGKFIPYPATWLNRGNWEDSKENKDASCGSDSGQAEFLVSDEESEADLIRRMEGG